MCGIIGIFHRRAGRGQPYLSPSNLSCLTHRGPDGQGVYQDGHVHLGHTRLSIIDLTEGGNQPMNYAQGRYVVTFNGEIYNYLELRKELEDCGECFSSTSDTEVLLAAYKVWDADCVQHFRGMFAFALWDAERKVLFLARDRCGEKPLFYHKDDRRFSFASELKGLVPLLPNRPSLEPAAVDMYLHYQYVPEPFTLLRGVHKLPAAHTLTLTEENWFTEPVRYWNVEQTCWTPDLPKTAEGIMNSVREGLEEAVALTLRADVPVGVALSGGIDSGAIATLAQKRYPEPMHAFCVGYPGRPPYDERIQAQGLAERLGMIFHEVELDTEGFVDYFPQLVRIMDEPIADPAAFGHYSVPKAAHDLGIKVLLTGIGGDELFWGYPWVARTVVLNHVFQRLQLRRLIRRVRPRGGVQRLLEGLTQLTSWSSTLRDFAALLCDCGQMFRPDSQLLFYEAAPDFTDAFRIKTSIYGPAMREVGPENPFAPTAIGQRSRAQIPAAIIRLLFDTWLVSNCLTLGDRVSMAVGVETRLPFLDVKLIERVMALRRHTPDHSLVQKAWLRASLKGILPDEVLTRPKAGFQPPVWEWLSGVVKRHGEMLRGGNLTQAGIVDAERVEFILSELPMQGWPGLFFAYKIMFLEMWTAQLLGHGGDSEKHAKCVA